MGTRVSTLLDAYALVALLGAEPAGVEVERLLRAGDCAMTTINLAEAGDVLERLHNVPQAESRARIDPLIGSALDLVELDAGTAWLAAELRSRHYHRTLRPVSIADCVLVASAKRRGGAIATADRPLIDVARDEDVRVTPLSRTAA